MKHIAKRAEPQELLDWKKNDKMYGRGKPDYERIDGDVRRILSESLRAEQGNICCYCERSISVDDSHIEHIKPQGTVYKSLSCDYENMLCSCQKNEPKGMPKHCGMNKGSWYVEETFISPLDQDCETRFSYTIDGQILQANVNDRAAMVTIEKCQLDIPKLKSMREGVIDTFTDERLSEDELVAYIKGYLVEKEENNGSYYPFYTTIKFLFGHLL